MVLTPRKRVSPLRVMARWGKWVLAGAMGGVLLFALVAMFIPALREQREAAFTLIYAVMGIFGLVMGWQERRRWYGWGVGVVGALILVSVFVPQLPGRLYIETGSMLLMLVYLFTAYGKKPVEKEEENNG